MKVIDELISTNNSIFHDSIAMSAISKEDIFACEIKILELIYFNLDSIKNFPEVGHIDICS
jgi:hypothetical protein